MAKIGQPVLRPLPVRLLLVVVTGFLYTWKKLRLPRRIWSRRIRSLLENWTDPMYRVLIGSCLKRAYADLPCSLRMPENFEPKADAPEPLRLSEREVEFFFRNGYLPPFDVFSEEEIGALAQEIIVARRSESRTYGFVTERDRHLDRPRLMEAMRRPAILERCAQLMGPDLLCWRSQFFYKPARGPAIQWHQASCLLFEDTFEPVLRPPDRDDLFQITVWCAVDEATRANGCLRILPGTADSIRTIRFGGDAGFYRLSHYQVEHAFTEEDVVYLEAKPGQVILFCERTLHGSGANATDRTRSAFNYRLIGPDTKVYKDKRYHNAKQVAQNFRLKNWGCVLMRGEDRFGLNRLVPGAASEAERKA